MVGKLHKDTNDKWHVIHYQATLNGPLLQSIPLLKEYFDINSNQPIIELVEGKEVHFERIPCVPENLKPTNGKTLAFEAVYKAKLINQ